ncbi:DUF1264 domain-containing protein [Fischerella sp. PCC 9605]|uniref:DUF1264 domain-containing protein n=1 Tax=Fischerella sp. PCC 9605 TaxID=1173024 RepID=UPI0004B9F818|nr:DUF1264 domain-containing protein [Fischerella sp. PCC 9605]
MLQDTTPINQLQTYLDGFHNYKREAHLPGESQHQMRVSHYCQNLNEEFTQCAIYDGNTANSHLIGIEYVVSDRVYQNLSENEKQYWHPHTSEVESGILIAPGIPDPAHQALMDKLRTTHGKTWHVWDTQKYQFPLGEPALMWAIETNQINTETQHQMQEREKSIKF